MVAKPSDFYGEYMKRSKLKDKIDKKFQKLLANSNAPSFYLAEVALQICEKAGMQPPLMHHPMTKQPLYEWEPEDDT